MEFNDYADLMGLDAYALITYHPDSTLEMQDATVVAPIISLSKKENVLTIGVDNPEPERKVAKISPLEIKDHILTSAGFVDNVGLFSIGINPITSLRIARQDKKSSTGDLIWIMSVLQRKGDALLDCVIGRVTFFYEVQNQYKILTKKTLSINGN